MKNKLLFIALLIATLLGVSGCHKQTENKNTIKVGTMAGPETQIMQTVKHTLKKDYGVNMQIITFTNYTIPNEALNNGDLDANYFQHLPYLNAQINARGYELTPIGKVFIYPMGVFSKKINSLQQLKVGDKVGIPNDPSNESRALLLLQKAKLITLRSGTGVNATVSDIIYNPKKLRIVALDGAQLPRSLDDLTIAVINNTFAVPAGLTLEKALFVEDKHSPYVNVVVVRTADKNRTALLDLIKAMHSPAVVKKAHEIFGNGVVKGW